MTDKKKELYQITEIRVAATDSELRRLVEYAGFRSSLQLFRSSVAIPQRVKASGHSTV
jgi:hypothetical protein